MKIYNSTNDTVILCIQNQKYSLNNNESLNIDVCGKVIIELKHNYYSTAMSKKYIASDTYDDAIISLILFPHRSPYFNIVLDCKYEILCTDETELVIEKQVIRPSHFCSYDRLYPTVNNGEINILSHTFSERQNFEKHYIEAISSSNNNIIKILLVVIAIFMIPIILICFLVNLWFGFISLFAAVLFFLIVKYASNLFNKAFCKVDCKLIFDDFDSSRIIKYFEETK